jgi:hypothetical protein
MDARCHCAKALSNRDATWWEAATASALAMGERRRAPSGSRWWAYHACREECSMSVENASVRAWSRPKARSYTAAMVTRAWERAAMGKDGGPEGWATKATAGAKLASGDGEAVRRLSKMVEALGQSRSVVLCQAANSVLARGQQKMRESSTRVRRATNT